MKKPLLYLCGPYSDNPEERVKEAMRWHGQLISEGFIVFCPHLSHFTHQVRPKNYETWMEQDLALLSKFDVLFRFSMNKSEGSDREVFRAIELNIPWFHDFSDLEKWRNAWMGRGGDPTFEELNNTHDTATWHRVMNREIKRRVELERGQQEQS